MVEKWIAELEREDREVAGVMDCADGKEGPKEDKARRAWLNTEHNLETNSAWWISERADGKGTEEDSPEACL
jgi:hypothetical protein